MHKILLRYFILILIATTIFSCGNKSKRDAGVKVNYDRVAQKTLVAYNKQMIEIQSAEIDSFIKASKDTFLFTQTGVGYTLPKDQKEITPVPKDKPVIATYTIKLLNGKVCYKTQKEMLSVNGNTNIRGIGETLPFLAMNYPTQLVVPFHLAYGLPGNEKVPAATPVLIEIFLEYGNLKKDQEKQY